jgi:ABC-type sugar transport system ATPase subunit
VICAINFLEKFQEGSVTVNDTVLSDDIKNIRQIRSEISMVFQHFNLFPHLSIIDNLTLAPIATFLAKPISWVTQSIVMPSLANSTITSSASAIISGSSAEVGSSNKLLASLKVLKENNQPLESSKEQAKNLKELSESAKDFKRNNINKTGKTQE